MKAAVYSSTSGGLEKNLRFVTDRPLPKNANALPKDSTLVKVAYTTPNPADYKIAELPVIRRLILGSTPIPGCDFSGTVVSTTTSKFKPGDRVCGIADAPAFSTYAEYTLIKGTEPIVRVPDNVSLRDASTLGVVGLTAYQCIAPNVKEGSKVFLNGGSGGTGTYGIQIAKALGCYVTTTCSSANAELCKSLGADQVIDYRSTDVIEHLKRQGTQYDLIVDNVGNLPLYFNAHHYLKPEGQFVTIAGDLSISGIFEMMKLLYLPSFLGGGKRKVKFLGMKSTAAEYERILAWMSEGKVKTVVEKEFKLEQAADAVTHLKTGRTRGKLVIEVGGEK